MLSSVFPHIFPKFQAAIGSLNRNSSRRKSVSESKKFLAMSGMFVLCCLTLTTALAFAKTNKSATTVIYPSGYAVSQPLSELPIDMSAFANREMPEPRRAPKPKAVLGSWQPDAALQKDFLPNVGATLGVDFDGIPAQGFA